MTKHVNDYLKIHQSALIIDTHSDTPQAFLDDGYDLTMNRPGMHISLEKMIAGGVKAQFFAIWVDSELPQEKWLTRALLLAEAIHNQVEKHSEILQFSVNADDIESSLSSGKISILMGLEGAHPLGDDPELIRIFYRLGVRYVTLTWSNTNAFADSSGDEPRWDGLSPKGKELIQIANQLCMLIDISHASDKTFWDVLKCSTAPVFASHSSCRALCNHPRNLSDDMLIALAQKGGMVNINFFPAFLDDDYRTAYQRARKSLEMELNAIAAQYGKTSWRTWIETSRMLQKAIPAESRPEISRIVDHIDHAVSIMGVDHVGLGSDFDGVEDLPYGINGADSLPELTRILLERGYAPSDIHKILGGNFLELFRRVTSESMAKPLFSRHPPIMKGKQ